MTTLSAPPFTDDDLVARRWLDALRDGDDDQKFQAREQLSAICERRGMLEEASELLETNFKAGSRSLSLFRSLMRIYGKREHGEGHIWAMQQAFDTVRPTLDPPPTLVGPFRSGACDGCGKGLGVMGWISARSTCRECKEWLLRASAANIAAYEHYLSAAIDRDDEFVGLSFELDQLQEFLTLPPGSAIEVHRRVYKRYLDRVLDDDHLTLEEEDRLCLLILSLGFGNGVVEDIGGYYRARIGVARANAGRLATLDDCQLILKKGKVAYLEFNVSLMKERVVKEWQSGSAGVSFQIAKGVRVTTHLPMTAAETYSEADGAGRTGEVRSCVSGFRPARPEDDRWWSVPISHRKIMAPSP